MPASWRPMWTAPAAARVLAAWAVAWGCSAWAGPIGDQVLAIEAEHGGTPGQVIELLRPLEAQARASQGDDLRIFLAAWGYAHAATDKPAMADAAIEELTDLGERTGNAAALASAYALKATSLQVAGQVRAAFGWIESAVPLVKDVRGVDLRYWVYMTAGDLAQANGQVDEAIRSFEDAVAAAREGRNDRRESQALLALVPLRIVRGEVAKALGVSMRVRELAQRAHDRSLVAAGWVMEALTAEALGDLPRAARARQEAEAIPRPQVPASEVVNSQAGGEGWLSTELDALLSLSALHLSVGNFSAARDLALRANEQARARRDDYAIGHALINQGLADLGIGRVQAGMKSASTGLAMLEQRARDAELLVQLNRYVAALERRGETSESWVRLRESLLLETELSRRDRLSTLIALQRESSYQQRQRQMEQLQHDNALQAAEIRRRAIERTLVLLLAGAMGAGGIVAWRLYLRSRESNRRLAETNQSLEHASLHDPVTGLFNRRAMEVHTEALVNEHYCCVSLSVKQFGNIVGSVGHQLGDLLLCQIATRLNQVVGRHGGRLYRIDGVTFGAIVRMTDDELSLKQLLEALALAMEAPFEIGNQDLVVSIGLGAAQYPKDANTALEVARLAELAKLQTHAEPGNTHVVYDVRIGESHRDKLHMEARMVKALEHREFELFYQGLRDVRDDRFCGFEALLRWRDGSKMVSPATFIPLAEETGLIVRIGTWVLRQACTQAKAWADAGLGSPKVAVNISPRQFSHPDFLATVRDTLRETGVNPAQIELEITETSVMNDAESSIAVLHALREMGLQLAIDDFGTGYASLSYLRRFPLNRLKIDRSFVNQLGSDGNGDAIVRTVIELAHCLGLSVTAEGVETADQEALLRGWSCDVVQGFLHSRPGPAEGATQLLRDQTALTSALI
ncbi:bifunctional diguanylate cyclase/phosphodiesterase [Ideonella sp. DXS29W]|uniref:Bifunctional diguanylate cyclase/phosphodiesterase n=1 Tax=Ideonella lacteola TaxID=2984193 RepID=A0ABU9BMM5_9BURK